jgi:hypothetical protein
LEKLKKNKAEYSSNIDNSFLEIKLDPVWDSKNPLAELVNSDGSTLRLYAHPKILSILPDIFRSF